MSEHEQAIGFQSRFSEMCESLAREFPQVHFLNCMSFMVPNEDDIDFASACGVNTNTDLHFTKLRIMAADQLSVSHKDFRLKMMENAQADEKLSNS